MSEQLKPVYVNGHAVQLQHAHRPAGQFTSEPLVIVTATVELTAEEVTAVLHDWISDGGDPAELYDDAQLRSLVAESVVNGGCLHVDRVCSTPREGMLLDECGRRAADVFSFDMVVAG